MTPMTEHVRGQFELEKAEKNKKFFTIGFIMENKDYIFLLYNVVT